MLTEYYIKKLKKDGNYRVGRSRAFLWYGIAAILIGILLPASDYLITGVIEQSGRMLFWSVVMVAVGLMMIRTDLKAPKLKLEIDYEGIRMNELAPIPWKSVRDVTETHTQLTAPNKKGFNFIAKSNKFLNLKMTDGTSKVIDLDGLSFNPLKMITALNLFSNRSFKDPKAEERSFLKLVAISLVAAIGVIALCVYNYNK